MTMNLKRWLPFFVSITLLSGVVFVVMQQNIRMSANDPQIQMSEDMAANLAAGKSMPPGMQNDSIEISQSIAPFYVVYDESGKSVASSGKLDGQIPNLPAGVLEYTRINGQDRVTWQPQKGVRAAVVVTHYAGNKGSGFVMVGRSLREVEKREDQAMILVGLGWVTTVFASFVAVTLVAEKSRKK